MIPLRLEVASLTNGPFFQIGRKLKRRRTWISVLFLWSWIVLMALQFVAGAQRHVLMKVLALNIICRGARRTCWTVIFALKRLWGGGVRRTWAAGLQDEQWSVAGQDETNDSNNTAAAPRLLGWEDGWTHSGMTPQGIAGVYPCCTPEKETAEANITLVSVCEVSYWSLISTWLSSCCLNTFLQLQRKQTWY